MDEAYGFRTVGEATLAGTLSETAQFHRRFAVAKLQNGRFMHQGWDDVPLTPTADGAAAMPGGAIVRRLRWDGIERRWVRARKLPGDGLPIGVGR